MRIFKTAWFRKFARKERISNEVLYDAVARAQVGLVDADLGGGVLKQRAARPGAGKSGGYRTILFFRVDTRAVFAFGFAKNEMANISVADERDLKAAAKLILGFSESDMDRFVSLGRFEEIVCDAGTSDENLS